jgi:Mrp family chromosome partitioning ATPase
VIVDAPPVLSVTDAVVLSAEVDAVLVVIRAGASTKHGVRRTRELLAGVGARMLGVVVNALTVSFADGYYYYGRTKYTKYYESEDGSTNNNGSKPKTKSSATA